MQANYSIVETTAPGDTRRRRRRSGSDKRRGELNARAHSRAAFTSEKFIDPNAPRMDTRDIYAGHINVPEKIRVVTSELLSRNGTPTSRLAGR